MLCQEKSGNPGAAGQSKKCSAFNQPFIKANDVKNGNNLTLDQSLGDLMSLLKYANNAASPFFVKINRYINFTVKKVA
jgi:hypothetical protein